jgi:1-acyl-sn-glycerol-3-phosphate acyltransferase
MMLYWLFWLLSNSLYWLVFPFQVFGQEHIPRRGGCIIASNHRSYADPYLLGVASPRRIHFVARDTLFRHPLFAGLIRMLGAIPIRRASADKQALVTVLKGLQKSQRFVIFPEGTRHVQFDGTNALPGIGLLAVKSGLPVIPVYVDGSDDMLPAGSRWIRRVQVTVRFGEPLFFSERRDYQNIANEIMEKVYALAP